MTTCDSFNALDVIAGALGVERTDERVAATVSAVRQFDANESALAALPEYDFRKRDIEALRSISAGLSGVGSNGLAYLAKYGVHLGELATPETAQAVLLAADDIERNKPSPRKGRRPATNRARLVSALIEIFECTGTVAKIASDRSVGVPIGPFF
jgi:hypothetical protein